MKKVMLLGLCAVMAMAAAGCGSANQETQDTGKVLKVATDADLRPFNFCPGNSKAYSGFDIDLMNAIAAKMGYDKVEYVNVDHKDILVGLNQRKYDAAIAGITVTRDRKRMVDFSDSYFDGALKVIVPNSAKGGEGAGYMTGKKVAGTEGGIGLEVAKNVNAAEVIPAQNLEDALDMVAAGKADCAVADGKAANFFLKNGYGTKLKFAGHEELNNSNMGIAVGKGNKVLLDKINSALHEVRESGEYQEVYTSYFGSQQKLNQA